MTVPVPDQLEYISDADGVTKDFSYPKRFLQKDEIVVLLRDADGVDTPQILNTHYTIAGSSWPSGGTISFITAPQAPNKVVRYRMTQAKQTVDLENNQRNDAPSVETQLDRLTMAIQDRGALTEAAWNGLRGEIAARIAGDNQLNSRVDQEIVDRATADAAIASLIGNIGSGNVPLFDTVFAASLAHIDSLVNVVRVAGYSVIGNGAALFRKVTHEPAHDGKFQSADGAWWELAEMEVSTPMLNIAADGVTDVAASLSASGNVPGSYFRLVAGTYFIGQSLVVPATWRFASGTKFLIADGVTVDFSAHQPEIHAPKIQRFYFAGGGTGNVIGLDEVHVGWFAGDKFELDIDATTDIQKAANAINSGGTLLWPRLWLASNGTSYISMSNGQNLKGQQRNVSRIKFLTASTKGFRWDSEASSLVSDFGAFTSNDLREPIEGTVLLFAAGRAHVATRFSISDCYDAVTTQVADCSFSSFKLNDNKRSGIRIEAKNETHIHDGIIAANSGWITLTGVLGIFSSGEQYTAPNGAKGSIWRNADGTTKMTFTTKSPQGQVITGSTSGATATVSAISLGHTSGAIVLNQRCDATVISDVEMSGGVCSVRMSAIDAGNGSLSVKVHNCLLDSNMGNCVIADYQTDTVFSNCWFSSFVGTNNDVFASNCRGLRFVDCTWITSNAVAASFNNCRDTKVDGCIVADTNTSNTADIPALWFTNCLRCSVRGVTIGSVYDYGTGNVKTGVINDNSDLTITDCDLSQCVTPIYTTNGGVNKINNVKGYRAINRGSVGVSFVGGQGAISHGLNGVPTYVNAHTLGDTTNYIQVLSVSSTQIVVLGRNRTTNAAIPDGTITIVWEAATNEASA
ncbi:hypothetical protein [Brucella intermedia]|uniref:hypothetical protein n=1 Tax=Brucella intermedia TaxID=94625 RepID=UPI00128D5260|nr:hypothetical protein [Brucella intermedia]